jgi:hypothetical protein
LGVNLDRKERIRRWSPGATDREEPAKGFEKESDPRFFFVFAQNVIPRTASHDLQAVRNAELQAPSRASESQYSFNKSPGDPCLNVLKAQHGFLLCY